MGRALRSRIALSRAVRPLCYALLAASGIALALRVPQLLGRGSKATARPGSGVDAPALQSALAEAPFTSLTKDASFLVLFVFTPQDCPSCLWEIQAIDRFSSQHPEARALAIMALSNPAEASQTRESFDLHLPILQDPEGELLRRLHPPRTPWKVLVRLDGGAVLLEDGPRLPGGEPSPFIAAADRLLR